LLIEELDRERSQTIGLPEERAAANAQADAAAARSRDEGMTRPSEARPVPFHRIRARPDPSRAVPPFSQDPASADGIFLRT